MAWDLDDTPTIFSILKEAGAKALEIQKRDALGITYKTDQFNLQTQADRECEWIIVNRLRKEMPNLSIEAEEGFTTIERSQMKAYLDPIDGTIPFSRGENNFSISLGIEEDGTLIAGFLYFPAQDKMVCGIRGGMVAVNNQPYFPKKSVLPELLSKSLIGFDFSAGANREEEIQLITFMIQDALGIRIRGSFTGAILEMLEGRWNGYVHLGATPYDLAASIVIAQEAGFAVSETWNLEDPHSFVVIARTEELLQEILANIPLV